ncbi:hypothetical protein ACFXJM_14200 [Streptomyces massasporeus]
MSRAIIRDTSSTDRDTPAVRSTSTLACVWSGVSSRETMGSRTSSSGRSATAACTRSLTASP